MWNEMATVPEIGTWVWSLLEEWMQRDSCLYPYILYMWTSYLFQNAYAVVFGNLVPFIVYSIFAAEIEKCMGSIAPAYTPEVTNLQNSPLLHHLCCKVWTTVISYGCKCSGFVAFHGSAAHTLLVLQVGLNISSEMSPAKHQISSSNG
jgi:hypothetical protein